MLLSKKWETRRRRILLARTAERKSKALINSCNILACVMRHTRNLSIQTKKRNRRKILQEISVRSVHSVYSVLSSLRFAHFIWNFQIQSPCRVARRDLSPALERQWH